MPSMTFQLYCCFISPDQICKTVNKNLNCIVNWKYLYLFACCMSWQYLEPLNVHPSIVRLRRMVERLISNTKHTINTTAAQLSLMLLRCEFRTYVESIASALVPPSVLTYSILTSWMAWVITIKSTPTVRLLLELEHLDIFKYARLKHDSLTLLLDNKKFCGFNFREWLWTHKKC